MKKVMSWIRFESMQWKTFSMYDKQSFDIMARAKRSCSF